ncbi:phosphotransferase [Nocardia cyriacigeorgica]|uniref:Serine/threonine protein kinase n=1 Tax=Nocardia cyriacigeorgica TaxID=135487 RepID=A0A4U8VT62_9NOCA|nr:aminoglycoside phosphotransferase family protein [Nocardia cyriacigeorgica]VFA96766.1 serine/threonine protein kinase [Nocardia cyriacigeorgica]
MALNGDAGVLGADAVGAGEDAVALGDDPAVPAADTGRSESAPELMAALTEIAFRTGASGAPEVLADRVDVLVIRVGEVVVKAHPADSDVSALRARLRVADSPRLRSVLLAPVPVDGETLLSHAGRPITLWPSGSPVDPEAPDAAPWESAARLLATLHAAPVRGCRDLPAAGGPARVHRAMRRLHHAGHAVDATAAAVVRRAYDSLPELDCAPAALTHGDFHLGQLVRPADGAWRLIDLDDLGLGAPAWDLARPAAFFAAGILDPAAWTRFLTAYRVDVLVIRVGEVVVKAHPADSDVSALRARLRVADSPRLRSVLLAPVPVDGETLLSHAGRPITLWPSGSPVDPEAPDAAPWESAARLLATLHAAPVRGCRDLPAAGGPARVHRAMRRLHHAGHAVDATAAAVVRRAYDSLPELDCAPAALTHGDFHLGQLVRPADGAWRLIDLDDLGLGAPAWDLARPAAFFAAGILDPAAWTRFLTAYRAAGGPAIPPDGDIWPALDLPARAVVVQAAALAVASGRPLDDLDTALVDTCLRLTETAAPEPISSSVTR